jgi:membrane protein implicated in regulation of membrane protease activity
VTDKKMNGRERVWLVISVAVPILGAATAAHLLAIARSIPPPKIAAGASAPPFWATEQAGWYASAVLCAIVAVVVAILAKYRESRKKTALEQTNEEQGSTLAAAQRDLANAETKERESVAAAKQEQLVKLRDEFMRFASTTADMALQPFEERQAYLKTVAAVTASALATMVGEHVHRPRAVVYLLNIESNPLTMDSIGHAGRGERPGPFEAGTPRGDAALEFLDGRRPAFYPNLDEAKPLGFEGTMSGYKSFISVPIWTATGVYGMVSLDAPKANLLNDGDLALTELTAELMSIPFEVGQDHNAPESDDEESTPL